jgi:hypothetical protein
MAETVTLEFLGAQMERMLADQAAMRDDIRVLTAIAPRHENTLKSMADQMRDMLGQMRAMVAQHQRFNDRLPHGSSPWAEGPRLEEQPAQ